MMYRRHAAQHSAKGFDNIASEAESGKGSLADFFSKLIQMGIFEQASRENRRITRHAKRRQKNDGYYTNALNGQQAMARRRRQIASGSLKRENGLAA